ncbi:hypothetical protein CC86DRAFT_401089 [Ophiobolus disseminans]|uniref:Uncharacterized protein n=1 Tax=Ophiobolus disseminans TaxID=1469910 RepID=A0A6A7AHY8_9PLEO|nr:hypothetical protein CC86DRAFT_401089 [Ophiobolus disseminans]
MAGDEWGCAGRGEDARKAGAVGDMVGLCRPTPESHTRGLAACTPPWRSRTQADAVEAAIAFLAFRRPPCGTKRLVWRAVGDSLAAIKKAPTPSSVPCVDGRHAPLLITVRWHFRWSGKFGVARFGKQSGRPSGAPGGPRLLEQSGRLGSCTICSANPVAPASPAPSQSTPQNSPSNARTHRRAAGCNTSTVPTTSAVSCQIRAWR